VKALLQGDFGASIQTGQPVLDSFTERFPATLELGVAALLIAIVVGVPLGYLAARSQGRVLDTAVVSGSLLGVVTPVFFLAILLKLVFADKLHWLPTALRQDPRVDATHVTNFYVLDGILTREWDAAWDAMAHLVLPALALATIPLAIIVRITRASVAEVMHEDFVRTAEAKGLSRATISRRHVLRNALLPVVTTIGLQAGLLFSGAVLTETVFAFNGIGQYLFEAIGQRDYPVLQGFIIFIAIVYSLINLIVDLAYGVIDPRVRTG
jgi:peptide/nickel transport system permease protein